MDNIGRLFGQVAAEAGVTENRAKIGLYLMGLSKQGKSIEQASSLLRRKPATVKAFAREFLIDFSDYRPFARQRDKGLEVEVKTHLNTGGLE